MNKVKDFKEEALVAVGLTALPKESTGRFDGIAVVKIEKITGERVYALAKWSEMQRTLSVCQTFDKRGIIKEIISQHPYVKKATVSDDEEVVVMKSKLEDRGYVKGKIHMWGVKRCTTEFEEIEVAVKALETVKVEDLTGTLEQLKARIADLD
jgi:hypothetical protein